MKKKEIKEIIEVDGEKILFTNHTDLPTEEVESVMNKLAKERKEELNSYSPEKMERLLKLLRKSGDTGKFIESILNPLYKDPRPKKLLENIDLALRILNSCREDVVKQLD
mgnify:CR=1 FL=1